MEQLGKERIADDVRDFYGLALEVHHYFPYSVGQKSVMWTHRTARNAGKCSLVGCVPRRKRK